MLDDRRDAKRHEGTVTTSDMRRDSGSVTTERSVANERIVDLRPRTILRVLLIVIAVAVTLEVVWIARHILAWVVIALFLALALNPLVGWIERHTRLARGPAIGIAYLIVAIAIIAVGATSCRS